MKASLLMLTAVLALGGCASHEQQANAPARGYVTGSYIPQTVNHNGPVSDGSSYNRQIDQSDIHNSGGATPRQTLRALGATP
jgi:hypothetical protein